MLEDRDYMRQPDFGDGWRAGFRFRWSWTLTLIAAYVAVWLAEDVIASFFPQFGRIFGYLALSRAGIEHGYVWQLLTYQFMHAGWVHLLFNCVAILSFGNLLERLLGARRYLTLMFSSGVAGGVLQVLVALLWPEYFGGAVVGASACAFGLVAAFATIYPNERIVVFPIPFPIRAKTVLIGSAVIAVMLIIFPLVNIANAAHLGGMAMGWFYVRKILSRHWHPSWGDEPERVSPSPEARPAESSDNEFMETEVDAILDKISAKGIQSLTTREREILEKARARMVKR